MRRAPRSRALFAMAAALGGALATGCSWDGLVWNNARLDAYLFENYQGERLNPEILDELGPLDADHIAQVTVASGDERLAAVLLRPPGLELDAGQTLLVYFHGSSNHLDFYWPRVRLLYASGLPVLAVDYRGYGTSTGEPTTEGVLADGHATLRHVAEQLGDPRVVVYANSLGTLVACDVVAGKEPSGTVTRFALEAVTGSIETLVQNNLLLDVPAGYVMPTNASCVERIRDTRLPLWWLHGADDEKNPIDSHGWPVWDSYQAANPGLGVRSVVDGAGHDDVPLRVGIETFLDALRAFVDGQQHHLLVR